MTETRVPRTWQDGAAADLAEAARQLGRGSVLVVGDAMLDRYFYGEARRMSPEAPVPVLSLQRELSMPGGAANVVRNITAVGAAAAFVSVVGDDPAGSDLTALIGRQSGVEPWLLVQGSRVTTVKTRFLAHGQHLLRADTEDPAPLDPRIAERLLRIATDVMSATTVTILSDYSKGVLAGDIPARLIEAAHKANRPIIVDPRGYDYRPYAGADVIMPNRRELQAVTGLPAETDEEIVVAARDLLSRFGIGAALVTRSEHGMSLITLAEAWHFPAEALDVHDVAGAGDTVAAVLAAGMAAKLPLAAAARLANVAAGIVVGKVGTAAARQDDILARLEPVSGNRAKIVSRDVAVEQAERWRRRGWRVGFTNGRFDRLHQGHVHLLEQARSGCDRLIVAVNSDASARRLKNGGRHIRPEADRAADLASLSSVDLVCVFDEDTPLTTIAALHPDLLVKGSDHAVADIVGADMVEGWGGTVMRAELLPASSRGNGRLPSSHAS
ncbi:bifunctional heptose 7-phosphate kinase/heptose 1-phosphate adenyltransferase [Acidisoma cladoniae]|jgi:D-beta-D-heptose 7-phosphate kinase/D-beta-D-heptose 1-phosphate adenosyltransferase|uniref:bifunctional heptose 7-phosphate kinase/heptose 1-phosphate adenyltransferase n=1 Tax=Acidisoma cladoniae TaxID=3040935 RepID=UPI00254F3FE8|nr:bifunctional heptose 7-phosphate kinase/heptose 1-phosphate adenyltransferase [Acidisoma sp. PAMC 29798]